MPTAKTTWSIEQVKLLQDRLKVPTGGTLGPLTWAALVKELELDEPVPDTLTPWMDIARREIGQEEVQGGENPRILEYHAATTLHAEEDEIAWCSAFVCWCLKKAGYKSTESAWARSYEDYGEDLDEPKVGCIGVIDWQDGSGHVGFVTSFTPQTVTVLGGNQSDSVCIATFSRRNVSAFKWPVKA
jgi:uncharacterized protein (TIGR02594 family)